MPTSTEGTWEEGIAEAMRWRAGKGKYKTYAYTNGLLGSMN